MKRGYKVLQGFGGSAGQPGLLARELRELGVQSESVIVGRNAFEYPCDHWVESHDRAAVREFLTSTAKNFDLIHIHAITPFFVKRTMSFPMGTDLLALKAAEKRIVVHFRGSEVRLRSIFMERSPYNYVEEDPGRIISKFPEDSQLDYIEMCRALADEIVVSDPELHSYVPGARLLPRAMDLRQWKRAGARNQRPLVVHAPSRQGVKGTSYVLAAVEALHAEGLEFDFRLVEGLPHHEAKILYEQSDIVVDQLRIGWYGVLSTEAMALGKTVVTYIRDDILHALGEKPPLAVANPDNIQDVLRELILNRSLREEIADRGYQYCRRVHDSRAVAKEAVNIYDSAITRSPHFDFGAYMAINQKQEDALAARLKDAQEAERRKGAASRKPTSVLAKAIRHQRRYGLKSLYSATVKKLLAGLQD